MKQEFLMLGYPFKPAKYNIAGWFVSEKLDGKRAYWDGGLSRGLNASQVPYANRVKDFRLKTPPIATGLWSKTGKVIRAPDWWLNDLPNIPLDGELWTGTGSFQKLASTVSKHDGGQEWNKVYYHVFDSPPFIEFLKDRIVKVRDYKFPISEAMDWYFAQLDRLDFEIRSSSIKWTFEMVYGWLKRRNLGSRVNLVHQHRLPFNHIEAVLEAENALKEYLFKGSEGIMLRKHSSFWETKRCHTLLKYKPWLDDEAVITGFTSGRKTDKGSKLLGKIGALIVSYNGKRLELSGLTHEEREFTQYYMRKWAEDYPGQDMPDYFEGAHFSVGDTITFRYRELSDDGIPKEARYFRKRGD